VKRGAEKGLAVVSLVGSTVLTTGVGGEAGGAVLAPGPGRRCVDGAEESILEGAAVRPTDGPAVGTLEG
jgi:hypothetical protein